MLLFCTFFKVSFYGLFHIINRVFHRQGAQKRVFERILRVFHRKRKKIVENFLFPYVVKSKVFSLKNLLFF